MDKIINKLEDVELELTKLLIQQDLEDKKNKEEKEIIMTQAELYKLEIKFVKFLKKYFTL